MNKMLPLGPSFISLVILYLVMSNMNVLNGNKYLYGVNVDSSYIDDNQIKSFNIKFRRLHTIGFVTILILLYIYIYLFKNAEVGFSLGLIAYLIYSSIIYAMLHRKIKNIKAKLSEEHIIDKNSKNQVFVDIDFLNERDKLLKKFKLLYLIPILIVLIGCVFTFINKDNLGDLIPIQFDFNGIPNKFAPNTTFNLLIFLFSILGSLILISFLSVASLKSRLKVDVNNLEKSKIENIKFLNVSGYLFLLIEICLGLTAIFTFATLFGVSINPLIFNAIPVLIILSIAIFCVAFIKSPSSKPTSSYSSEDDEKNWVFGMIYNNSNDPSFMVRKRFGIGWTVNVGTPLGKIFFIATLVILLFSLFTLFENIF